MQSYTLLILVVVFFLVIVAMTARVTTFRAVMTRMVFFQLFFGGFLSPADGGTWSRHMFFFYGSFDAFCWLFRRELAPVVEQQTGRGFLIRLLLLTSPIWFAVVFTAVALAWR